MSAEDRLVVVEEQLARTRTVAVWALTLALLGVGWGAMAIVINNNQTNSIRDLQHRVGQLEEQVGR